MEVEGERVVEEFLDVEWDQWRRTGVKTGHYIARGKAIVGEADFDGDVEEQIVVGMNVEGERDGEMGGGIEEEVHLA